MAKNYTQDQKSATLSMYYNHSLADTSLEMGVSVATISTWYRQALDQGAPKRNLPISLLVSERNYTLDQKHEACTYYSTHTGDQASEKYGMSKHMLHIWRKNLGYPNKHYGRNLKADKSHNDVAILHAKAMAEVSKQKDAYRDKMREFEELIDGLRSDASSIQHKMFDFMQSLNDE